MDTPVPGTAQLLHEQQQMMATLADLLRLSKQQPSVITSLLLRLTSARPWKMDFPVLSSPEDSDLTSFTDWLTRWVNYLSLTRDMDGIKIITARQRLLCSALHLGWSVALQTGRLDVQADDVSTLSFPNWSATPVVAATRYLNGRSSSAGPKVTTRTESTSWPPWSGFTTSMRLTTMQRAAQNNCGHSFNRSSPPP